MSKTTKKHCRTALLMLLIISLFMQPMALAAGQSSIWVARKADQALRVTYTCVDKPIAQVLMDLAEQANVDIVKSPKITGDVTAKVTAVPLGEALTNILAAHDCTFIATANMIRVMPLSEITLAKEELVSRVYRITYADANEVAVAVAGFVSEKGKVAINRGTSHIVVTDVEKKIKAVDEFIAELDRETAQVLVEVRIYDITTNENFNVGAAFHAANMPRPTPEGDGLGKPTAVRRTITPGYTTTTITASPGYNITTTETVQGTGVEDDTQLGWTEYTYRDVWPFQQDGVDDTIERVYESRTDTTIESISDSTTYETTPERTTYERTPESRTYEVVPQRVETETIYEQIPVRGGRGYRPRGGKPFVGGSFDQVRGGTLSFSLLNDAIDIDLALNMLKKQVEAKLLANPQLLVLDNHTADFEIVRKIPYRELQQVGRADPITYTAFEKVGVSLEVTPHITRDGMIRLHLTPEFGILVGQDMYGVPTVDARRVDTVALIKDGQTIAIGGLRKTQKIKSVSKVPLLGDIPLLGNLFRSESESEEISELLVLITPRIITSPDMLARDLNNKDEKGIPRRMSGIRPNPQMDYSRTIQPSVQRPMTSGDVRSPELSMRLAYAYLKMQQYKLAKERLTFVIQHQRGNNTAYQYLAYCHLKLGELDKAIESYRRAIELDNRDWEAHRGLGVAYMLRARANKDEQLKAMAVEQWKASLQINQDQPSRDALLKMIQAYSE